jgi:hypothetical protein
MAISNDGWEKVADYALGWTVRQAAAEQGATSSA